MSNNKLFSLSESFTYTQGPWSYKVSMHIARRDTNTLRVSVVEYKNGVATTRGRNGTCLYETLEDQQPGYAGRFVANATRRPANFLKWYYAQGYNVTD